MTPPRLRHALLAAAALCCTSAIVPSAHALDEDTAASEGEEAESTESEATEGEGAGSSESEEPEAPKGEKTEAPESEAPAPPEPPRPRFARVWIGVGGALDLLFMPSGTDLCKLTESGQPANDLGAYCTNPNGSDFPTRTTHAENDDLDRGFAGSMEGGLTTGNLRVLFSADYAPLPTLLIGTRLGYVFGHYPGNAAGKGFPWLDRNLHAELRATYVFGTDPLARIGFAPIVFVAGGAAEFDAQLTRYATLKGSGRRPVDIWIVRGPWFVAAGAGARYQFSPRVAFNAALRLNVVLGSPALLTAGPDIGLSYGF